MPRNGSGTMSVVNTFTPSTIISSSQVNANFTDIVDQLTNSLAADGQTTMLAPIKGANGAAATPGYSFAADLDIGMYRKGANQLGFATAGVERAYFDTDGTLVLPAGALTIGGNDADSFPAGTVMLFCQTAAPTGWTKDAANNNNAALRIVTGAVGTGGTVDFTTAFASQAVAGTTDGTAISVAQMAAHRHLIFVNADSQTALSAANQPTRLDSAAADESYSVKGSASEPTFGRSESIGGGATHNHAFTGTPINLAVKYRDAIQATKD